MPLWRLWLRFSSAGELEVLVCFLERFDPLVREIRAVDGADNSIYRRGFEGKG